jgi:hypothetical protein
MELKGGRMSRDQGRLRTLVTGDYPVLESVFIQEIHGTREHEPFKPLLILVSSKLLGLHLRRLQKNQEVRYENFLLS